MKQFANLKFLYILTILYCFVKFLPLKFTKNYSVSNLYHHHPMINVLKWPKMKQESNISCLDLQPAIHFNEIPKEALDPNSQFFGLIYKDMYGKSTFCNPETDTFYAKVSAGLPKWESFFPNLVISLNKYAAHNPNKNWRNFTSRYSYIEFEKQMGEYTVGETFEAKIQAVDFSRQKKLFGGDYFRARLLDVSTLNNTYPDGIPCVISDLLNGTYVITAPLLVPGEFKLEVILCASVETIAAYVDWSAGRIHQGYVFRATLETGDIVECNMDLLLYDK